MKSPARLTRIASSAAAAAIVSAGLLATADPAAASSFGSCPNNTVCLYTGTNFTGTRVFAVNGTTMHDYPRVKWEVSGGVARSSINTTLGRFCTLESNQITKTNILNSNTHGNLAKTRAIYVGEC